MILKNYFAFWVHQYYSNLPYNKHKNGRKNIKLNQDKRYFKIDQHLARYFKYNGAGLSSPPPFLCSQIITPFSNSMISANQETGL